MIIISFIYIAPFQSSRTLFSKQATIKAIDKDSKPAVYRHEC